MKMSDEEKAVLAERDAEDVAKEVLYAAGKNAYHVLSVVLPPDEALKKARGLAEHASDAAFEEHEARTTPMLRQQELAAALEKRGKK
jgi:hypothetical protein